MCGKTTQLEFSVPAGDAPCPHCGCLLWFSRQIATRMRPVLQEQLNLADAIADDIFLDDLNADSLDLVELIMALEDEFDFVIPDTEYERLRTVGDVIRYLQQLQQRES